jgi:hypothetical protein
MPGEGENYFPEEPAMPTESAKLPSGKSALDLLEMYFLDARMHLLETAAFLDRIGRARESDMAMKDPRVKKLLAAAKMLSDGKPELAERFHRLFSVK